MDPVLCRRALREIGEIAAVAVLDDSQMSEPEALESIAAIAAWVRTEPDATGRACRQAIVQLHALTTGVDFDRLEDAQVHARFNQVLAVIRGGDAETPEHLDLVERPRRGH